MKHIVRFACLAVALPCAAAAAQLLKYDDDHRLAIPADYREWVFLTSSLDLNYSDMAASRSVLDNVFVNPDAYKAFVKNGTWPDNTVLIKENRVAEAAGTISKSGKFQTRIASMEMHVKDEKRFRGGWAFFVSNGTSPGVPIPVTADCFSCHAEHGAVNNTFVQFYPTLLEIAKAKATLSPGYVKDTRALSGSGK